MRLTDDYLYKPEEEEEEEQQQQQQQHQQQQTSKKLDQKEQLKKTMKDDLKEFNEWVNKAKKKINHDLFQKHLSFKGLVIY